MVDFGGIHIYPDNNAPTEYNRICSDQIDETMSSFIWKFVFMLIASVWCVIGPTHAYIIHGIKTTTIQVVFPLVEEHSDLEFMMNVILMLIGYLSGFPIYLGMEIAMNMFTDIAKISPKLIELRLRELDEMIGRKEVSEAQVRYIFTDIVKQSTDHDK